METHPTKTPLLSLHTPPPPQIFQFSANCTLFNKNTLFLVLGPLLCLLTWLFLDLGSGREPGRNLIGVLGWIFEWWILEAVPVPVTSMSPLFLFPVFGVASAGEVAKSYMNDVIALVLGSFILALAIERYNIHRRLALNAWDFYSDPITEINTFVQAAKLDAVITDFPETAIKYRKNKCLGTKNTPPYMQAIQPSVQPPVQPPSPLLTVADVAEPSIAGGDRETEDRWWGKRFGGSRPTSAWKRSNSEMYVCFCDLGPDAWIPSSLHLRLV